MTLIFFAKTFGAAAIIAFVSWLAGKRPELAGFLTALPLVTLIALAFAHAEHRDAATSVDYARSVFLAVPISLLFFVPFLLAERLGLPFWALYAMGLGLLAGGYFAHRALLQLV